MVVEMISRITKRDMPRKLSILDVGARGGLGEPWTLFGQDQIDSILVEPDPVEAINLQQNENSSVNNKVLPFALWDHDTGVSININKSPATSSVFKANKSQLQQYPESDRFNSEKTIELPSKTIDQLFDQGVLRCLDFMKIDVQGGELHVIRGGKEFLKNNLIGIEVEVEFIEMYENQPLFSDVENYIRTELGLELWDLKKYYWKYSTERNDSCSPKGKLVFADAIFFRPLNGLSEWLSGFTLVKASEKIHMLLLVLSVYGYYDYMQRIIESKEFKCYIDDKTRVFFTRFLEKNNKQLVSDRYKSFFIYKVFHTLAKMFEPNHHGWAKAEPILGNKKKWKFWW